MAQMHMLQGDPTYLIVTEQGIEKYGVNSICTHLGCVVPWNAAQNKVGSAHLGNVEPLGPDGKILSA